ncbi:cation:proton antiporter [Methylomonas rhizoryzae]|uniref:cation:proton antiporter n=1 Tax=Methylomonas rhizoryzae TaxID=2608981 RepID=UPI0012326795|nr:cation:proton antiporter [Methylomonas rhizoryzae]
MSTSEIFLIAISSIYTLPYLIWRIARTDYFAPLVVVQIGTGILLGPGVLGAVYPEYYSFVFNPSVLQALNGIAWWAVMLFVWVAGIELDLGKAWEYRLESSVTAGLALGVPLLFGCAAAMLIQFYPGWIGERAMNWQFILGIGMSCAVTALPILILLLDKLRILRHPLGQRILRYASLDDIAIWAILSIILLDWTRIGKQLTFLVLFPLFAYGVRRLMAWLPERDRWYLGIISLAFFGLGADWAGLHFMVGAFLAGAILDSAWFEHGRMDQLRQNLLLTVMPVFFLSTGLKTHWSSGGLEVLIAAGVLLIASVSGKLLGLRLAGKLLNWQPGEASIIGWLLQTKALIMIIFANVLLDKQIITGQTFTALLVMALLSTMLTVPAVAPKLARLQGRKNTPE